MRNLRILLVDNYDSYTWNLYQLIWKVAGVPPVVVRNDETTAGELLRRGFTHVVISPGPGTAAREADFGLCRELLARVAVPCLGVCLGHQGIALAFRGTVRHAPEVVHGRTSPITHTGTGVFAGLPQGFRAVRYHSLAVAEPLPPELVATAWSETGVIMGLAHRHRPLHGVQFHPESVESEYGEQLIANFLAVAPAASAAAAQAPPAPRHGTLRWRQLDVELSAEELYLRAFADRRYSLWLDSSRSAYGMGRYSYLAACDGESRQVLRAYAGANVVEEETAHRVRRSPGTVFERLRSGLARTPVAAGASPVPFAGGYAGYLGYGIKGSVGIGKAGSGERPDAELLRIDRFAAFDHETGRRYLVTVGLSEAEHEEWCAEITTLARRPPAPRPRPAGRPAELGSAVGRETYLRHFEAVQRWLNDGESYEACYTYQITGTSDTDPLDTYRRLRAASPAPYAAYLRLGERSVLSSSPERFVTVADGGWVETKPIKGTAARHPDPEADEAARRALETDPKIRSENLMIADLLRNDLGQVCEPGTVHVPRLMAAESYATVHQLVTTVRGRLRAGHDAVDCVRALFPGGSMTGAPKRRTVELLDALEPEERGVYSGCLGFFGFDGRADQSIVIRTIVREGDRVRIGVGGALIVLSDAEEEYQETRLKAAALLRALGIDEPSGAADGGSGEAAGAAGGPADGMPGEAAGDKADGAAAGAPSAAGTDPGSDVEAGTRWRR
ncbi:aminodeoxychorismate synthase component I [Kitasatospora sp. NPDC056138]|uniref:aminodeoxychorismate synthase component I n=1 Tax=Kitasatospora sp. NPDC056138 TaxID=3345724 RepID=UPI0035E167A6